MKKIVFALIIAVLLFAVTPVQARVYLTQDQALEQAFPGATAVRKKTLWFTREESKKIHSLSGKKIRVKRMAVYIGKKGEETMGYAFIDHVIGKKDFITYMVVLDPGGAVRRVDVLVFRESQGYEIENRRWRDQFTGKTLGDQLQLNKDIVNISGATLSCRAVTGGIKKILAVFNVKLK